MDSFDHISLLLFLIILMPSLPTLPSSNSMVHHYNHSPANALNILAHIRRSIETFLEEMNKTIRGGGIHSSRDWQVYLFNLHLLTGQILDVEGVRLQ